MSLTDIKVRQAHCKEKTCFYPMKMGLAWRLSRVEENLGAIAIQIHKLKTSTHSVRSLSWFIAEKARQVRDDFKDNNFCFEHDTASNLITFGKVGEEWLQFKLKNAFNDLPRCGVLQLAERCLQQDIYPDLQDLPFQNIKRYDLVSVIKK